KSQLEEQIKRKTRKLTRSNQSLELLFQVSRRLNEVEPGSVDFQPLLNKLADVTGVKDLDLCIMTAQGTGPYEHLMSSEKTIPDKCQQQLCHDCTEHDSLFPPVNGQMKYQLNIGDQHYGVLVVSLDEGSILEDWQHQLFEAIAEQVANGLSMKHQNEQRRRIALMNERTVIARELHDSLAQALSYLKIQVTRLQRLQQKESAQEQIDQVIDELKNGLGAAYSELRELLTTFRLKLDGQGIKAALEQTISQLQNRSDDFSFTLNYHVSNVPFTPQEEIHLLQIAREATQNAFYHSQGSNIEIGITSNSLSEVILTVKDNGIGIPEDPNKLNHYGLAIMKERSRNLDGELSVKRNDERGTTVMFSFIPEYARTLEVKSKSA
ncbi:MAG: ATP-binding protein, partial [Pseudomonadota bacterium]|nr:ATP-binding protein [Pseudomonadota bacterium]